MGKIVVRDKVYIPLKLLYDKQEVKDAYTKLLYKDSACKVCEYKEERHCHVCDTCAAYSGTLKLWSIKTVGNTQYMGLPIGDKRNIEKVTGVDFSKHKIVDKRIAPPFDYPVKFKIKLRPHQEKLVKKYKKKKYGIVKAPPRFGKTVCMVYLAVDGGTKTLVLASQHEFLQQYIYHIEGNEKKGIPKCTNLPELQLKHGKKLYGFPKTDEDFENFQIFTMTYHQFMDEMSGKKRFNKIKDKIGQVQIDEVHKAAASEFSRVVSMFYTKFRMGVTGTVERKDGRHWVIKKVIGPVVAESSVEALTPKVFIKETGIKLRSIPKQFTFAMLALARNKKRNQLVIDTAIRDVKNGHGVVIPLTFKKHIFEIVDGINKAYGRPIARAFIGGGGNKNKRERDEILSEVADGKVKVVVGIRSLIQLGLNVPKWSAIYIVMPISNEPNLKQETARVCTPMDGKRQPIIRMFYDECMGISIGCAKNSMLHMKKFKYKFSDDAKTQAAVAYFYEKNNRRGRNSESDEDEFKPVQTIFEDDPDATGLGRFKAGRR